jgi:hypothetical protein
VSQAPSSGKKIRLAAVVTAMAKYLHPQHIVDRFNDGYGWNGEHHHPDMELVSLYVDQPHEGDLSHERADRYPHMKLCKTIEEALMLGTNTLAVDGVVVVGEHGTYPLSDKGIETHPHWEFFDAITKVFRKTGKSVPYFNDKELSYKWEWCKAMVDISRELKFPFQGGSSLAVTWRVPSVEFPTGAVAKEAISVGYGGPTSYDFHGLETIQCMVERRKGGETGVKWLQAYSGDAFWKAHESGAWSQDLFRAALSRSATLRPSTELFTNSLPTIAEMKTLIGTPVAYQYQHNDGLKCTMMLMNGLVRDFTFAATIEGSAKPFSTQMYLPMPDGRTTLASFFSPLVHNAEEMFLTGKAVYPIERTLMTSGLLIAGTDSLRGGRRIDTDYLSDIHYQPSADSTFWRS